MGQEAEEKTRREKGKGSNARCDDQAGDGWLTQRGRNKPGGTRLDRRRTESSSPERLADCRRHRGKKVRDWTQPRHEGGESREEKERKTSQRKTGQTMRG